jgi:hypothetical protein
MPREVRLARLGSMFVDRDVEHRLHAVFDRIRSTRLVDPEPTNVLVTGESGVGKSDILARYLAKNPSFRDESGSIRRPVLCVEIKNMATPRSTARQMLTLLGLDDPAFQRGSTAELTGRVKNHLIAQSVELCMLDEFSNTLSDDGRVRTTRVATWVKDLCKSKTRTPEHPHGKPGENICFAMIGTAKSSRVVDPLVNPELASLTPYQVDIPRYLYRDIEEVAEFRAFLDELDQELPFDEFSGIGSSDENGLCPIADKIHAATYVLLRPLGYLIREAAALAILEGAPHIFERHLYESVERQRGLLQSSLLVDGEAKGRSISNPFTAPLAAATSGSRQKVGFRSAA